MAKRHKSAIKQARKSEKHRMRNASAKSHIKTETKKLESAIQKKDVEAIKQLMPKTVAILDKIAAKRIIHPNSAARKKSSLMRRSAQLLKSATTPAA